MYIFYNVGQAAPFKTHPPPSPTNKTSRYTPLFHFLCFSHGHFSGISSSDPPQQGIFFFFFLFLFPFFFFLFLLLHALANLRFYQPNLCYFFSNLDQFDYRSQQAQWVLLLCSLPPLTSASGALSVAGSMRFWRKGNVSSRLVKQG